MTSVTIISTDPIADMLTRVRNAIAVGKREISLPHSQAKENVAKILASSGFITSAKTGKEGVHKTLEITINGENEAPRITSIKRLSRPGRRMYVKSADIPMVRRGRGIVIISTSHGVMSGGDAKKKHLGGELICEVF